MAVAQYLGIRNVFSGTVPGLESQAVVVDGPRLEGQLHVPLLPASGEPMVGAAVSVGIRAEFVALRNADHPPNAGEFVLEGRFTTVSVTGTDVTLLFKPDGLDLTLEISVGRRLLRRFGVKADQPVTVGLPRRDLLLFTL